MALFHGQMDASGFNLNGLATSVSTKIRPIKTQFGTGQLRLRIHGPKSDHIDLATKYGLSAA
jgi:hypothetical protein